jgi:hypothetical protein
MLLSKATVLLRKACYMHNAAAAFHIDGVLGSYVYFTSHFTLQLLAQIESTYAIPTFTSLIPQQSLNLHVRIKCTYFMRPRHRSPP